jgi:TolA-binding protein
MFSLSGCLLFKEKETITVRTEELRQAKESKEARMNYLLMAKNLLDQNDFEGALKEYQKLLTQSGQHSPADEALFQIGMIYAHFGNPKKDYGKSLTFLKKLLKDFPQSPRAEQARLWVGLLQEHERLTQTVQKLQQTLEEIKKVDIEIEEKKKEKMK